MGPCPECGEYCWDNSPGGSETQALREKIECLENQMRKLRRVLKQHGFDFDPREKELG